MYEDNRGDDQEEGVEVPYQHIAPETLQRMIQEFVSRDGADWGDAGGSLEEKVEQVLHQLRSGRIRVVVDLTSQTANLVEAPAKGLKR